MRIFLDDAEKTGGLVRVLRECGCLAVAAGAAEIEAHAPGKFGYAEFATITEIAERWSASEASSGTLRLDAQP